MDSVFDFQVLYHFANTVRWITNRYQKAKKKLTVYLHPFLSTHVLSCFILKHQWSSTSIRCGPVYNSPQPGSLKKTCQLPKKAFCLVLWKALRLHVGYLSTDLLILSVWRVSLTATVSVLLLSFLDMSGSHRKNSWRRVLTVSGHSIMTMWLPSSMTFRNANRRI